MHSREIIWFALSTMVALSGVALEAIVDLGDISQAMIWALFGLGIGGVLAERKVRSLYEHARKNKDKLSSDVPDFPFGENMLHELKVSAMLGNDYAREIIGKPNSAAERENSDASTCD